MSHFDNVDNPNFEGHILVNCLPFFEDILVTADTITSKFAIVCL